MVESTWCRQCGKEFNYTGSFTPYCSTGCWRESTNGTDLEYWEYQEEHEAKAEGK